ncbi:uncharacterized protein M6D78_018785 [Vipera latastei]
MSGRDFNPESLAILHRGGENSGIAHAPRERTLGLRLPEFLPIRRGGGEFWDLQSPEAPRPSAVDVIGGRRAAAFQSRGGWRSGLRFAAVAASSPGRSAPPPPPTRKMAARLLPPRCYWLFRALATPSGFPAGRLAKALGAASRFSQVAESKSPESKFPEKSAKWEELVMASSSVEELLNPEHLQDLGGNQASLLITRWSHLASRLKLDHQEIRRDMRFQQLLRHTYKEENHTE